jgi:hypothetical protein
VSAEIVRTSEWQEFVEWLTVAWQKYCDKPAGAREGAIRALTATAFFIKRVDPTKRTTLAKMFSDLACALMELDSGFVDPILRPKQFRHRRQDNFERQQIKEAAAITMTLLFERGFSRPEAAKAVAALLRDCGIAFGGRSGSKWKTVAAWRDQMKNSAVVRITYTQNLAKERGELMKELPRGTTSQVRECALDRLLLSLLLRSEQVCDMVRNNKAPVARSRFIKIASQVAREAPAQLADSK